jgi:hypothetical protein
MTVSLDVRKIVSFRLADGRASADSLRNNHFLSELQWK